MVDPFCGTGAIGEAALRSGRAYFGGDNDDVAVRESRTRLERVSRHLLAGEYPDECLQKHILELYVNGTTIHLSAAVRVRRSDSWCEGGVFVIHTGMVFIFIYTNMGAWGWQAKQAALFSAKSTVDVEEDESEEPDYPPATVDAYTPDVAPEAPTGAASSSPAPFGVAPGPGPTQVSGPPQALQQPPTAWTSRTRLTSKRDREQMGPMRQMRQQATTEKRRHPQDTGTGPNQAGRSAPSSRSASPRAMDDDDDDNDDEEENDEGDTPVTRKRAAAAELGSDADKQESKRVNVAAAAEGDNQGPEVAVPVTPGRYALPVTSWLTVLVYCHLHYGIEQRQTYRASANTAAG